MGNIASCVGGREKTVGNATVVSSSGLTQTPRKLTKKTKNKAYMVTDKPIVPDNHVNMKGATVIKNHLVSDGDNKMPSEATPLQPPLAQFDEAVSLESLKVENSAATALSGHSLDVGHSEQRTEFKPANVNFSLMGGVDENIEKVTQRLTVDRQLSKSLPSLNKDEPDLIFKIEDLGNNADGDISQTDDVIQDTNKDRIHVPHLHVNSLLAQDTNASTESLRMMNGKRVVNKTTSECNLVRPRAGPTVYLSKKTGNLIIKMNQEEVYEGNLLCV